MINRIQKGVRLNWEERKWLIQHGGRTGLDVNIDEEGDKYVFMSDGYGGEIRIYLPIFKDN